MGHRSLCTGRLALTALDACLCACTTDLHMGPPHNLHYEAPLISVKFSCHRVLTFSPVSTLQLSPSIYRLFCM